MDDVSEGIKFACVNVNRFAGLKTTENNWITERSLDLAFITFQRPYITHLPC